MERSSFESVLDSLPFGALVVQHTGEIRFFNRRHAVLLSDSARTGQPVLELLGEIGFGKAELDQLTDTIYHAVEHSVLVSNRSVDGVESTARLHFTPITDDDGQRMGLVVIEALGEERQTEANAQLLDDLRKQVRRLQHELNNQLMGMLGHAELLHLDETLDAMTRAKVAQIIDLGRRLQAKVETLRQPQ